MKNTKAHPREKNMLVHGSFMPSDSDINQEPATVGAGETEMDQDSTASVPDDYIYVGKPLSMLYSVSVSVFNIASLLLM